MSRPPLFSNDERTIIVNRDLLVRASRTFIQSGLAAAIEPRWHECVNSFASELGLRLVDSTSRDGSDPRDTSDEPDSHRTNGQSASAEMDVRWPAFDFFAKWDGIQVSRSFAPTLELSPAFHLCPMDRFEGLVAFFTPGVLEFTLDYTNFSKEVGDRKLAEAICRQYSLEPDPQLWVKTDSLSGSRKITRVDTPWQFGAADNPENRLAIDAAELLRGKRPPSLTTIAPHVAKRLIDYVKICDGFQKMQQCKRLKLSKPAKEIRQHRDRKIPSWEHTSETEYLQRHATTLLKAVRVHEAGTPSAPATLSLADRMVQFLDSKVRKKCSASGLTAIGKPPTVDDPPASLEGMFLNAPTVWKKHDHNLTLAVRVSVPPPTDRTAPQLIVVVFLNTLLKNGSLKSLMSCKALWDECHLSPPFRVRDGAPFKSKTAIKPRRFWGYYAALEVDLKALAEEKDQAGDCLDTVLTQFSDASKGWRQLRQ